MGNGRFCTVLSWQTNCPQITGNILAHLTVVDLLHRRSCTRAPNRRLGREFDNCFRAPPWGSRGEVRPRKEKLSATKACTGWWDKRGLYKHCTIRVLLCPVQWNLSHPFSPMYRNNGRTLFPVQWLRCSAKQDEIRPDVISMTGHKGYLWSISIFYPASLQIMRQHGVVCQRVVPVLVSSRIDSTLTPHLNAFGPETSQDVGICVNSLCLPFSHPLMTCMYNFEVIFQHVFSYYEIFLRSSSRWIFLWLIVTIGKMIRYKNECCSCHASYGHLYGPRRSWIEAFHESSCARFHRCSSFRLFRDPRLRGRCHIHPITSCKAKARVLLRCSMRCSLICVPLRFIKPYPLNHITSKKRYALKYHIKHPTIIRTQTRMKVRHGIFTS